MENILDEQLEEKEILKPIPLIIYLFMVAIFFKRQFTDYVQQKQRKRSLSNDAHFWNG